jgi:probable dihydroxyacetone kinase regulator
VEGDVHAMPDSSITKKALAEAIKELMTDKPFSKISVGDICKKCDMNRNSFYYHFKDKYDLVNWIFYHEFFGTVGVKQYDDSRAFFDDMCVYFYDNRQFYTKVLEVSGQNSFRDYFREMINPIITQYIKEVFLKNENAEFFTTFYSDAILMAIMRWLMTTPCMPPEEFIPLMRMSFEGVAKKIVSRLDEENS